VLVAGLPLVMDPAGWLPYLSARWAVLVAVAGVAALAGVGGDVVRGGVPGRGRDGGRRRGDGLLRRIRALPAVRWWGALALVVVAAVAASPAPRVALVGAIDRRMGGLTWLAHGALFVVAAVVVRRRSDVRAIAHGLVVGTFGVAAVTMAQQIGWSFPAHAVNRARPGGPFGNADVLAAYCVVGVVVSLGVALDRSSRLRWRCPAMVAAALGMATTAASGARGGWIGLAAAVVVIGVAGARRGSIPRRRQVAGFAVAGAVLLGVLAASGTLGRAFHVIDGTARGRIDTWVVGMDAVAERPVLGWGPDGLADGLQRHVDDDYERRYTRRLLPDRAHSAPLDVAGTLGLLGLAAWLGLLAATARGGLAGVRRYRSPTALAIGAGLLGLLVCELSLFPTFDVDAIAWILAGALVGVGVDLDLGRGRVVAVATVAVSLAAVAVAAIGSAVVVAVGGVGADHAARRAADALATHRPRVAVEAARASLEADPGQTMPALLLAEAAVATSEPRTIDRALAEVESTRRASIDDGRLALAEGRLLDACGGPRCERWRPHVQRLADQLVRRDPARSDGWRMEATLAEARGDAPSAEAARRRVIELAPPDDDRPWRELAETLRAAGDAEGARDAASRAVALDPFDDANLALLGR
jgi:O-antigen ligase